MDRDPEAVLGQFEYAGDEVPSPGDGIFLEVVAEAEVAEHLEERLVPAGVADVLQVVVLAAGAHATLATGRPNVVRRLATGQRILELHHPGVGE